MIPKHKENFRNFTFVCDLLSHRFVNKRLKIRTSLFQTFSEKNKKQLLRKYFYCTRVNLRLNPKFVFEVGKVFATKGLFIV